MNKLDLDQFAGHTPGPWTVGQPMRYGVHYIMVGGHTTIAELPHMPEGSAYAIGNDKDRGFNARLIAAAPALLSECRRLQAENERLREALVGVCQYDHVSQPGAFLHGLQQARAALNQTE